MNAIDNGKIQEDDINLGLLLNTLDGERDAPLVFYYDGRPVKPGYHITEVKAGQFSALDCGANPEAWTEIFIQLWDIEEGDRTHMPAGKFQAIIRKVTDHVQLDGSAKLTFEVSDGVRPMQLYCAAMPISALEPSMFRFRHGRQAASRATAGWQRKTARRRPAVGRERQRAAAARKGHMIVRQGSAGSY